MRTVWGQAGTSPEWKLRLREQVAREVGVGMGAGQQPAETCLGQDKQETWRWGPDAHRGALPP